MNEIEKELNMALEVATIAKEMNTNCVLKETSDGKFEQTTPWQNVLISGLSGSGKTSAVKEWAKQKGVLLVPYDLKLSADTIYNEDEFGILRPQKVNDPVKLAKQLVFSALSKYKDKENFILFLDDYNLARKENMEAINYTIDTHKIFNPVTNEEIELKNLLFTIAIETV